jgi:hypothetical protein
VRWPIDEPSGCLRLLMCCSTCKRRSNRSKVLHAGHHRADSAAAGMDTVGTHELG